MTQLILFLAGCGLSQSTQTEVTKLSIGLVAYGEGKKSLDQYARFIRYLEKQTTTLIELEPAYNEVQALEQIKRQAWSLVFAPPGLATIAITQAHYQPLFPLQGVDNLSSLLIVPQDSLIRQLTDVTGHVLALGQPGSATGYYVPLYELYGTAPAEVRLAPTPQVILEWLANHTVDVGAIAKDEFDRYHTNFQSGRFRVLHSSRRLPSGAVLISPNVDSNQQNAIQQAMAGVTPAIAAEVGYIPNADPPDYGLLITVIRKVQPIEANLHNSPAQLYR